jgi:hypothetical protein
MTKPKNDPETMARIRETWRQANASVRIEGGVIDDETLEMQERHIRGEISKAEYSAWVREEI